MEKETFITFSLCEEEKEAFRKLADAHERTISGELRALIKAALRGEALPVTGYIDAAGRVVSYPVNREG